MIDPKYAGLPGLAYDQPDIYETDDPPVVTLSQDLDQADGEGIEKIHVTASDAYEKFKDKSLESRGVDFSNSIAAKKGYSSSTDRCEMMNYAETETSIQRCQRLKDEIEELLAQMDRFKRSPQRTEDSKVLIDILNRLEASGRELDTLNIKQYSSSELVGYLPNNQDIISKELESQIQIFKQTNKTGYKPSSENNLAPAQEMEKQGALKYQMIYFPDKAELQDLARVNHLESRLGYLENILGTSNESSKKCSQVLKSRGISKSIENLMENACLLNTVELDNLERKVSSLIVRVDAEIRKNTTLEKEEEEEGEARYGKIIPDLFQLLKESDSTIQALPQTIDRMLFLSRLHQKAAEFTNRLKELEDLQVHNDKSLDKNQVLLEEIQNNLGNNLETIYNNILSLDERMKTLKK